jgi:hypothetical protein
MATGRSLKGEISFFPQSANGWPTSRQTAPFPYIGSKIEEPKAVAPFRGNNELKPFLAAALSI